MYTIDELGKYAEPTIVKATLKTIKEEVPFMDKIPFEFANGGSYTYYRETFLGTAQLRKVGASYTAMVPAVQPFTERLKIIGGEVKLDNFEVAAGRSRTDMKQEKFQMAARAVGIKFSELFLEGDESSNLDEFNGLKPRLTGDQKILNATGGGALTLSKLDQLIDAVVGDADALIMNRTLQRKILSLVRDASGGNLIMENRDDLGRRYWLYAGVPLWVVERQDDASTYLAFDEDPGDGTSDTASIYCVRFGPDYVHGLVLGDKKRPMDVKDFGEIQSAPQHLGRIEWYVGLAMKHPRAAARLYGITNA